MPEYGNLIILKKGDVAGPVFPLRRRQTQFGSDPAVDICIKRDDVEPVHARIDIQPLSHIHITNLSVDGAVMVNKTELTAQQKYSLSDKDIINIRGRKFRVELNPEPFENKENVSENVMDVDSGKTQMAVVSREREAMERGVIKEAKQEVKEKSNKAEAKKGKKEEKEEEKEEESEEVEEPPKPAKQKKGKKETKKSKKEVEEEAEEEVEVEEKPKKKKTTKKEKQQEEEAEEEEETVVEPKTKKSKTSKSKAKKAKEVQEEEEEEEGEQAEEEEEEEEGEEEAPVVKKKSRKRSKSQRITDEAVPKPGPRTPVKRKERTPDSALDGLKLKRHKRETEDLQAFTAKLNDRASRRDATPVKAPVEEKKPKKSAEEKEKEKEKAEKAKAKREAAKEEKARKAKVKAEKDKAARKAKKEAKEAEEEEVEENGESEADEEEVPKKKEKKEIKKKKEVKKKDTKPAPKATPPTTPTKFFTPKEIQETGIEVVSLSKEAFLPHHDSITERLLQKDDKHKGKRELKMLSFQSASQARFMTPDSVRTRLVTEGKCDSPKRSRNAPARLDSEGTAKKAKVEPKAKKAAKKEKQGAKKPKKEEEEDVDIESVETETKEKEDKDTEVNEKPKKKSNKKSKKGKKESVSDAEKSPAATKTKSAESPRVSSANSSMEVVGDEEPGETSEWMNISSPAKSDSGYAAEVPRDVYALLTESDATSIEDIAKKAFEEMGCDIKASMVQEPEPFESHADAELYGLVI